MKKYFLILLMITGFLQAQTYQNPTFGTITTKTTPTVTSVNFLTTVEASGQQAKIDPILLPINTATQTALDLKLSKSGEGFNYATDFDDVLSQDPETLAVEKRVLQPEATRLPIANTTILGWGDSLTAGAGSTGGLNYLTDLSALTGGFVTINKGVGGETSTQIKDRFIADSGNYDKTVIIWAGRNNFTNPNTVKADIATMIATLTHTRYLVVGILNGEYANEYQGGVNYNIITQLNSDLKLIYGKKYIAARELLVSLHDNTAQGLLDYSRDIVPYNLRSDNLHLNNEGYQIVANLINKHLGVLLEKEEYLQSKDFLYYNNLFSSITGILNQNATDQTGNFRITGTGTAGSGFISKNGTATDFSKTHHIFQNGTANRFSFALNGSESGSNSGSNFLILSNNDAGVVQVNALQIFRNSGNVLLQGTNAVVTADAGYKLDANGSIRARTNLVVGSTGNAGVFNFARASDGLNVGTYGFTGGSDTEVRSSHSGGSGFFTWYTNSGGLTERMRLSNAGDLVLANATANTIASFDGSKNLKSLPLATYPSLTELSYVKDVTAAIQPQIDSKAPLSSPALTGTPTAPTATSGTNTTQLATTAFVQDAVTSSSADIQDIVDATTKTGLIDSGNSQISVFDGSADNRTFYVVVSPGGTDSADLEIKNDHAFIRSQTSTSGAIFNAISGIPKILRTKPGTGTTEINVDEPIASTIISTPALSAGAYKYAMQPNEYTVATLPTPAGSDSRFAIVTDATAPTYLGALTGGGSVVCPVFYNGAIWVSH